MLSFSREELDALGEKKFFQTKEQVIAKIRLAFEAASKSLLEELGKSSFQHLVRYTATPPKISTGENYQGLPYMVMDYPRHFNEEDTLSFRIVFWWANYFSLHLHLSGASMTQAKDSLKAHWKSLGSSNFYLCVSETPWEYHFEIENFQPIASLDDSKVDEVASENGFLKIAKKLPLDDVGMLAEEATTTFLVLAKASGIQDSY